jgi:hypothetical protein
MQVGSEIPIPTASLRPAASAIRHLRSWRICRRTGIVPCERGGLLEEQHGVANELGGEGDSDGGAERRRRRPAWGTFAADDQWQPRFRISLVVCRI